MAYAFTTPHSLPEIMARLNRDGGREWGRGDNDDIGEYIGSGYHAESGKKLRLRIFFESGASAAVSPQDRCVLDILFRSSEPSAADEWSSIWSYILRSVLPLAGATKISKTEDRSS